LPLVTILLLANPEIQTLSSRLAAAFLTSRIGAEVQIGSINLTYKGAFRLKELSISDNDGERLLHVGKLEILLTGLNRKARTIHLGSLNLTHAQLVLRKEQEDDLSNLAYFLQHFTTMTPDTVRAEKTENPWILKCSKAQIQQAGLIYLNKSKMKGDYEGIDFSDLDLKDINIQFQDLMIERDTISAGIIKMSLLEKSGFNLQEFSGEAVFSPVGLSVGGMLAVVNNSALNLDLRFDYNGLKSFSNFIESVNMDAHFRNSTLDMSNIGYFAPTMFGMSSVLNITGHISGTVSNLKGEALEIAFGDATHYTGSLQMTGLPDITGTYFAANITHLTTDAADLSAFTLPGEAGNLELPAFIANAGTVEVSGRYTGFYNNFVSQLQINTDVGRIKTNLTVMTQDDTDEIAYQGKIEAQRLNTGELLDVNSLGAGSFFVDFKGKGITPQTLDLTLQGAVKSVDFMDYNYKNITINGRLNQQQFEGLMAMQDDNLDFSFNGLVDLNEELPVFNFKSNIHHADLFNLKLSKRDSTAVISTALDINFEGIDPDKMVGTFRIDSTIYTEGNNDYFLDSLIINAFEGKDGMRSLHIFSDIVDAGFEGKYQFSTLPYIIADYIGNYSGILPKKIRYTPSDEKLLVIDFWIDLKETEQLSKLFVPQITLSPNIFVNGLFHSDDKKFDFELVADYMEISIGRLHNARIASSSEDDHFYLDFTAEKLLFSEPTAQLPAGIGVDSLMLRTHFTADSLFYSVQWNDLTNLQTNAGDINGVFTLESFEKQKNRLSNFNVLIDGSLWSVSPGNVVFFDKSSIQFDGMNFYSDTSKLAVYGTISKHESDSLLLDFKDINISNLDRLANNSNIDITGVLNGSAVITGLFSNPNFILDLYLRDLFVNNEKLGNLEVVTWWNDPEKSLWVDLEIYKIGNVGVSKVVSLNGNYYPESSDQNFDFDVQMNNLGIQLVNPFISEYATISPESLASGKFKVGGSYQKPVIDGQLKLMRSQFLIHYLNTLYSLAGTVDVRENRLSLDGLTLHDTRGRSATCTGYLRHSYFRDFSLDLTIDHENFRLLNTTSRHNELFYGDAVATGQVHIYGSFDDLTMDIIARSENGTRIAVPISTAISVAENDFIIFRGAGDDPNGGLPSYNVNLKGLEVNIDLEVTPSAEIEIFLPYGMGNIEGVGNGDIGLSINKLGDFSIYGDYIISKGNFFFSFENIIGRNFDIREGSRISWSGDPYDAVVDIIAVHNVKADLEGLPLQTDSTALYNAKIPVECIISLKNDLFNPDIHFSMDFTNVPDDTKEVIFAALDTTDQSAMSQQIISLLLIQKFSYTANTPNFGATSFKLLSNQLSGWLSKISKDFDIGISYQPGTQLTEDELEVALSTQLFDDRLSIDGNFGVRGSSSSSQNTSNVVGDINVEYKITQDGRFRVKAFNRTNNLNLLENNAPYTQGVGLFLRKEFEFFGDLFRRKKEKSDDRANDRRNEDAVMNRPYRVEEQ
jgi:hypothetical protein